MDRRVVSRLSAGLAMAAVMAGALTGCADETASQITCTQTMDCPKLAICEDGICVAKPCDATQAFASDCGADGVCSAGGMCTPIECGCIDCDACAEGLSCVLGLCVAGGAGDCSGDTCKGKPCTTDASCDTLTCRSGQCQPATWCGQDADCSAGTCDLTSNTCVTGGGGGDTDASTGGDDAGTDATGGGGTGKQLCRACPGGDDDCGGDELASCVAFGGAAYCLTECTTNNECPTGFQCFNVGGVGTRCIPGSGTCDRTCIQEGCGDGQVCEFDTGNCVPKLNACDSCQKDDYCGEGNRCVKFGPNDKKCVPQCAADDQCPQGAACTTEEGVKVCKPSGAQCCFGASCGGDACGDACEGETPACWQGTCVQCLNDGQCGAGQKCDTTSHKCTEDVGPQSCDNCTGTTPVCHPQLQKCVECLNSTHCGSGQICDPNTNSCTGDICAACGGDYPQCAEINGEKSCVQCTDDSHCTSGACKNYWCEGGGSGPVSGECQTNGCPTSSQFVLACDQNTGLCFDTAGSCDGITAFCDAASGSTCVNLLDSLGGGGGTGLPPDLLPGAFGACTCRPPGADIACIIDAAGAVCLSKGTCLGGVECGGFTAMCGSF